MANNDLGLIDAASPGKFAERTFRWRRITFSWAVGLWEGGGSLIPLNESDNGFKEKGIPNDSGGRSNCHIHS